MKKDLVSVFTNITRKRALVFMKLQQWGVKKYFLLYDPGVLWQHEQNPPIAGKQCPLFLDHTRQIPQGC